MADEIRTVIESPSALLERAAAHLEQLAEHFKGYERAAQEEPQRVGSPVTWWAYDTSDRNATRAAKAWLETMSPVVAVPLVEWLHAEAMFVRGVRTWRMLLPRTNKAVAFARVVLGEQQEVAGG